MPKNVTPKISDGMTPKQRKAIESLLTSWSTTQAAAAAGISRETLYRWMREDNFKTALQDATHASLEGLSRGLVTLGSRAVVVLSKAMADEDAPQAVRVRAADIVLTKLLALRELVDLEERITALEKQNDNQK